jgi:hypothetical protein
MASSTTSFPKLRCRTAHFRKWEPESCKIAYLKAFERQSMCSLSISLPGRRVERRVVVLMLRALPMRKIGRRVVEDLSTRSMERTCAGAKIVAGSSCVDMRSAELCYPKMSSDASSSLSSSRGSDSTAHRMKGPL